MCVPARYVLSAIFGPLILYFGLLAHVLYHVMLREPEPVKLEPWPRDTFPQLKNAIIQRRKQMIREFLDFVNMMEFFDNWCTQDVEYEDPIALYRGLVEVVPFMRFVLGAIKESQIQVHDEHHSPHEIIIHMTAKVHLHILPNYPITLTTKSHLLLEPPAKPGAPEKAFRIYDEFNGNPLLNENTTSLGFIGRIHAKLRRFHGYLVLLAAGGSSGSLPATG